MDNVTNEYTDQLDEVIKQEAGTISLDELTKTLEHIVMSMIEGNQLAI